MNIIEYIMNDHAVPLIAVGEPFESVIMVHDSAGIFIYVRLKCIK